MHYTWPQLKNSMATLPAGIATMYLSVIYTTFSIGDTVTKITWYRNVHFTWNKWKTSIPNDLRGILLYR